MKLPSLLPIGEFRDRSVGLADLLPYGIDLHDGIILNYDGSFTVIYSMRGPDISASSPYARQAHYFNFARAMNTLGEGWMVHTYLSRGKIDEYPLRGEFISRTAWLIEQERIQSHKINAPRYFNDIAIALTYAPVDERLRKAERLFRDNDGDEPLPGDEALEVFENGLRTLEGLLKGPLRLMRLGKRDVFVTGEGAVAFDDRLKFLVKRISGYDQETRALPSDASFREAVAAPVRTGPRLRVGDTAVAVISLDEIPERARTTLMRDLYAAPYVCDVVTRWIARDPENIRPELKIARKKLYRDRKGAFDRGPYVDEAKLSEASDVNDGLSAMSAGEANGYFSFAVVLRRPVNPADGVKGEQEAWNEIDAAATKILGTLRRSGFTPRRETVNVFDAWLMTLPGMGFAQVRKGILGSRPFSYLSPLTSVWLGNLDAPCSFYPSGSTALTYAATEGDAPMAFNLHVGQVGHTLLVGGTGGGKSTLLAFLVAQHERYGPRSRRIVFDLNRSMKTLVTSMEGGVHVDLHDESIKLAPFADIRTPGGIERAQAFLGFLLTVNGVDFQKHRRDVYSSLRAMANGKTPPSMTALESSPYMKSEVREVIRQYTRGHKGAILDGEADTFPDASTICIELEHIINLEDVFRKPILVALMNRIEQLFDGRPTLFIFDEAWAPLNDDVLARVIGEKIVTVRKANVAMVFGTQSLSQVRDHKLGPILLGDSVPTKIFTPNANARSEIQARLYLETGLEEWEIATIADARRGDYYVANSDGRRLVNFGMGPVTLAFVGTNDRDSLREIEKLVADDEAHRRNMQREPERPWPARWIEHAVRNEHARAWADLWIRGFHGPLEARSSARTDAA
jgi:type IV secretion system protein VirB4